MHRGSGKKKYSEKEDVTYENKTIIWGVHTEKDGSYKHMQKEKETLWGEENILIKRNEERTIS